MMKVKMITTAAGPEGVWPAGSVQVVDEAQAKVLIAHGYASAVDPVVEVAAIDPVVEVADAPAQASPKPARRRKPAARKTTK